MTKKRLEVITGCMFAGKTEELLRRLRRAKINQQDIKIITPEIDERYGKNNIASHNGENWDAEVIPINRKGVEQVESIQTDVLAVDEFNFFNKSFVPTLQDKADQGTRVIVVGLDQTYRGEPFSPMEDAMAVADNVQKLDAICEVCGDKATRTQRLVNGEPASADAATIVVGGEETYQARCRDCHEVK